jgi:hypothetical protein
MAAAGTLPPSGGATEKPSVAAYAAVACFAVNESAVPVERFGFLWQTPFIIGRPQKASAIENIYADPSHSGRIVSLGKEGGHKCVVIGKFWDFQREMGAVLLLAVPGFPFEVVTLSSLVFPFSCLQGKESAGNMLPWSGKMGNLW